MPVSKRTTNETPASSSTLAGLVPYWSSECGRAVVYVGDCRDVMAQMGPEQFHAIVTDPPYNLIQGGFHLRSMTRNGDGTDRTQQDNYKSGGFMGQIWDGTGVAFDPATWEEVSRITKPGAHLLSFGGTRTYHRLACAIEDARFKIIDCIMWVYGSGFPKSQNVSKAIDKMLGAEREKTRTPMSPDSNVWMDQIGAKRPWKEAAKEVGYHEHDGDEPVTDAARQWQGWGTALKPSYEPIVLARKPFGGSAARNVLEYGCGGLNIDATRIGDTGGPASVGEPNYLNNVYGDGMGGLEIVDANKGRWPANLIHDGSDEVVELFPKSKSASAVMPLPLTPGDSVGSNHGNRDRSTLRGYDDSGSAARFFYTAKADDNDRPHGKSNYLDGYDTIMVEYSTQEGKSCHQSRLKHETIQLRADMGTSPPRVIDVLGSMLVADELSGSWSMFLFGNGSMAQFLKDTNSTIKMKTNLTTVSRTLSWLMTSLTNASIPVVNCGMESGGNRVGSVERCNQSQLVITLGKTASLPGAKSVRSGTQLKISASVAQPTIHPTCKPLDLMQYLVRLVCAPGGTILDLFMGSGSTGCAAILEGMRFVGIEQSQEYADIAVGRLKLALTERPNIIELPKSVMERQGASAPLPPRRLRG